MNKTLFKLLKKAIENYIDNGVVLGDIGRRQADRYEKNIMRDILKVK